MIKSSALSMAHVKIYLSALQVLRILTLILEEIPEDEVSLGVPELTMGPDNSDEDEGILIDSVCTNLRNC